MDDFFNDFTRYGSVLGAAITFFSLGYAFARYALKQQVETLKKDLASETSALTDNFTQGTSLWLRDEIHFLPIIDRPRDDYRLPTLVIGNLKGGVGKTTLSSNIAACLALRGKRVLVLDLDWQGSLANVFNTMALVDATRSDIDALFCETASGETVLAKSRTGGTIPPTLSYVPAYKGFGDTENQMMIKWIRGQLPFDAHYLLANCLLTREVKAEFDVIVIDTPPRMTTGLVNALSIGTHVIIPTVLDETSGEAAAAFLKTVHSFKAYNPRLRVAAIVGCITKWGTKLTTTEEEARENLIQRANEQAFEGEKLVSDVWIPRREPIAAAAGRAIASLEDSSVRELFQKLIDDIGLEI